MSPIWCWLVFMLFAPAELLLAQTNPNVSQLTGIVEDSTGGVISGACITLLDSDNQIEASTVSTRQGRFSIEGIDPGEFVLQVESKNFETMRQSIHFPRIDPEPLIIRMRVELVMRMIQFMTCAPSPA